MKHKHRPCPCGCGEMADECMQPSSWLNAFQIREPEPKPKWTDLIGIDPDYLGGKSVDEFLDEQRGEA